MGLGKRLGRSEGRDLSPRPSHPSTGSGQAWEGGLLRDEFVDFPCEDSFSSSPSGDIVPEAKRSGRRELGFALESFHASQEPFDCVALRAGIIPGQTVTKEKLQRARPLCPCPLCGRDISPFSKCGNREKAARYDSRRKDAKRVAGITRE